MIHRKIRDDAKGRSPLLIAYDTPSAKRRRRIHRLLRAHTAHVQESVFLGWLSRREAERLRAKLAKTLDPEEDAVLFLVVDPCHIVRGALGKQTIQSEPAALII